VATRWRKNFEDMFIRFDTVHERDRHTHTYTQFNLQTTPCLPLAFVRIHQMAPPRSVMTTSTRSCSLLLTYRPRNDERLSWPTWPSGLGLSFSGRFTNKVVTR